MSVEDALAVPGPNLKLAARLRKIGVTALLLGAIGASLVYWRGKRSPDHTGDPSMGGFNKANERQMELMYGKMGTVTEDLVQQLKRPGTQAGIIAICGGLVAAGSFYLAKLASQNAEIGEK